MQAAQIFQLAIAALPLVQVGVQEFVAWIQTLRSALVQSGEWTAEMQSQYRAALWAKTQDPAYAPDPAS